MKKMNMWNKIIFTVILLGSMYYAVEVIKEKDFYQFLIVITVTPVALLPYFIQKIGKIKLPDMLESLYMIFIFLAYFLGSIMKLYGKIEYYDLFVHFTSGILSAMFAYYLYKMANKKEKNISTIILFILGLVALVAVSWEIFEFVCDKIFKKDAQYVQKTGVDDTMTDMIVALVGAILFDISYYLQKKKEKGKIMKKYIKEVEECYGK